MTYSKRFLEYLKEQENAPLLYGVGPAVHGSPEGGLDTVGFGHKLTEKEANTGKVYGYSIKDLTAKEAEDILRKDLEKADRGLRRELGVDYENLDPRRKEMLLDYQFNLGSAKTVFPDFTEAVLENNPEGMLAEYERKYRPKGSDELKPLTRRNKAFAELFFDGMDVPEDEGFFDRIADSAPVEYLERMGRRGLAAIRPMDRVRSVRRAATEGIESLADQLPDVGFFPRAEAEDQPNPQREPLKSSYVDPDRGEQFLFRLEGKPMMYAASGGLMNAAQTLSSEGRGGDSTLVHMTADEVRGLQALAESQGTSLTINPETGLPEAFKLGKIFKSALPILAGAALTPFTGPLGAAAIVGLGGTLATGDLGKGLMAGLGAYGGGQFGQSMGLFGAKAPATAPAVTSAPSSIGATGLGGAGSSTSLAKAGAQSLYTPSSLSAAPTIGAPISGSQALYQPASLAAAAPAAATAAPPVGFAQKAFDYVKDNKAQVALGGLGLLGSMGSGEAVQFPEAPGSTVDPRAGTERPMERELTGLTPMGTEEVPYFRQSNPVPGYVYPTTTRSFQAGGYANLNLDPLAVDGSGVVAGLDALAMLGERIRTGGGKRGENSNITGPQAPEAPKAPGSGIIETPGTGEKDFGVANLTSKIAPADPMKEEPSTPTVSTRTPTNPYTGQPLPARTPTNPYTGQPLPARTPTNPYTGQPLYAQGGSMTMPEGSFILDARTVSEIGNGSSRAGQERLAAFGGMPLMGPGDGVSDSIRANIGGVQEARVARDEVLFTPEAVARIGNGDLSRGTRRLYQLMEQANAARRRADRGEDTKVHKKIA